MKKLDKALNNVLEEPLNEMMPATMIPGMGLEYEIRDEAELQGQYHDRKYPSGLPMQQSSEKEEPMDKIVVAIQHHFINGDFDKASELMQAFRGAKRGQFFTWHHMNQLMDWVRNIYKYTNMKDLSRNYYEYEMSKDMKIQGVDDLTKVKVRDETISKFVEDAEKVLNKKLKAR